MQWCYYNFFFCFLLHFTSTLLSCFSRNCFVTVFIATLALWWYCFLPRLSELSETFQTLLRVRIIFETLCDIYILVVVYRHSLLLFGSWPGNKALECISVSHTIENVISVSLKCSSVFPFFKTEYIFISICSFKFENALPLNNVMT